MHKEKVIGNCIVKVVAPREVTPQDVDDIADAMMVLMIELRNAAQKAEVKS